MGHMEIFDALDAAYTDCYYRKGIEEYIVAQKDLNLLKKFEKCASSESFEPKAFMLKEQININDFPKHVTKKYISEICTSYVLCNLFDSSAQVSSIVLKKAFETLGDFISLKEENLTPLKIYDNVHGLPYPFANAFLNACTDDIELKYKLLYFFNLEDKTGFCAVVNEIGINSFAKLYTFLCLALEYARALESQPVLTPDLDKFIKDGGYDLYSKWISSINSYIDNDLEGGHLLERHPEFNKQVFIKRLPKSSKKEESSQNRILYATLLVNRERFFEKLISGNWVAQPDNRKYDIELIDRLKYFFYDNNDIPSVEIPQDFNIKWCKRTISLNFLIRLLNNFENKDVKMEDIINNLGTRGEISSDYIADLKYDGGDAVWPAVKSVFQKNNAHKTKIDSKTKDIKVVRNEIISVIHLFYDCKL